MSKRPDPGLQREIDQEVDRQIKDVEEMFAGEAEASRETVDGPAQPEGASDAVAGPGSVDRREFMRSSAALVSGAAIAGTLQMFHARKASASHRRHL
jgi:hypothetical protein